MKPKRRDYLFIAVTGVMVAFLLFTTFQNKPVNVPLDDTHRPLLEMVAQGGSREEAEKRCLACHGPQAVPLSAKHPPKEQCLICHKQKV
jgi:cytochrome c553